MKPLKFEARFVKDILSGKKTTTWRLFDDKDLKQGDRLQLINKNTGEVFGKAVINEVRELELQHISDSDYDYSHTKFSSKEELLESFKQYYGAEVLPESILKIVRFSLLDA